MESCGYLHIYTQFYINCNIQMIDILSTKNPIPCFKLIWTKSTVKPKILKSVKGTRGVLVATSTEMAGPWMKHLLRKLSSSVLFTFAIFQWSGQEQFSVSSLWEGNGDTCRLVMCLGHPELHQLSVQCPRKAHSQSRSQLSWPHPTKEGTWRCSSLRAATQALLLEGSLEPKCRILTTRSDQPVAESPREASGGSCCPTHFLSTITQQVLSLPKPQLNCLLGLSSPL